MNRLLITALLLTALSGCVSNSDPNPIVDMSGGALEKSTVYPSMESIVIIAVDNNWVNRPRSGGMCFCPVSISAGEHILKIVVITPGANMFVQKKEYDMSLGELKVNIGSNTKYSLKAEPAEYENKLSGKAASKYSYSIEPFTTQIIN